MADRYLLVCYSCNMREEFDSPAQREDVAIKHGWCDFYLGTIYSETVRSAFDE